VLAYPAVQIGAIPFQVDIHDAIQYAIHFFNNHWDL
jgi:hypothetical protein